MYIFVDVISFFIFLFFWSGLRGPKAYSLWGGVVPSPRQRFPHGLVLCEGTEQRGGARVPQRWWEQPGIDWRLAREQNERAEAAGETCTEATVGTTTATTETETSGSEKGTGEEASLGASGSSGAEWSGVED